MFIIDLAINLLEFIISLLNLLKNIYVILILIFIIFSIHLFLYVLRDRKYLRFFKKYYDPESISLNDLKSKPQVNIIIPAWKEGQLFKECLCSLNNLSYPNLKIIVNAGGNEETLEIANSFKKFDRFIILHQKGGADRPSLGKVKAINECIKYINEGIVYFIDADSYLNDEILLRVIYPIINLNEDLVVGGVRPIKSQENNDFVKYLLFDRFTSFRFKYSRYSNNKTITGQNFCLKYEIIKSIGLFTENQNIATDRSMGFDTFSKGYKAYQLRDYRHRIYVDYSGTINEYIRQKTIWIENSLIYSYKYKKIRLIKFFLLYFISLVILIFPFLYFLDFGLFFIGSLILLYFYLIKIRKFLFFISLVDKKNYEKYSFIFFLKLIFFLYIDAFIIIRIPIHYIFFKGKLKKKSS